MELFIRLENGQPVDHPIMGDNFRQAFPDIDTNNLPENFARFERTPPPQLNVYEVYEGATYGWVDGVVKDIHSVRPMTDDEKTQLQDTIKAHWAKKGYASWSFDEELGKFQPPIPYPEDDKTYAWNEEQLNWIEVQLPERP